jgi:hypothetical protein
VDCAETSLAKYGSTSGCPFLVNILESLIHATYCFGFEAPLIFQTKLST